MRLKRSFSNQAVPKFHGIEIIKVQYNHVVFPCVFEDIIIFNLYYYISVQKQVPKKRVLFVLHKVSREEASSSIWKDSFSVVKISSKNPNVGHNKL